jgi:hypothetical protein
MKPYMPVPVAFTPVNCRIPTNATISDAVNINLDIAIYCRQIPDQIK